MSIVLTLVQKYTQLLKRKDLPITFKSEFQRAVAKHPPEEWGAMDTAFMIEYLLQEVGELKTALWEEDLHGEHGILREAVHVQVVAQRIIDEMMRRVK